MKLEVIIEKGNDNTLWGRIQDKGDFLPVTNAENTSGVLDNLNMLIGDYLRHEGKEDPFWRKVNPDKIQWDIRYEVQPLFDEFDFLNITKVAEHAGINPGLLRQYAAGVKHPSAAQAKKIEETIHRLADGMRRAHVYAG